MQKYDIFILQKYGKTLKRDRFFPIFYTFAEEFNRYMKYLSARFAVSREDGSEINDDLLLQTVKDVLCECAGEVGFEAFDDKGNIVYGYIQQQAFNTSALDECIKDFPVPGIKITYDITDVEDKNWNETWETRGFEPIIIKGRCVIHDALHPVNIDDKTVLDIIIDSKQSFGTGSHETTFMIISELLEMDMNNKTVLDCGCGTGILSIVSEKSGANKVVAYDIDEWSVENTRHNCGINGVEHVKVLLGNSTVLSSIQDTFDVVLANINRNILIGDMPSFIRKMKPGSVLLLSGFYDDDANILIDCAERLGLKLMKKRLQNKWCMLKLQF